MHPFRNSPLDTEVFGFPIARGELTNLSQISGLHEYASHLGAPLLVARCNADQSELKQALVSSQFECVETLMSFSLELEKFLAAKIPVDLSIRNYRREDETMVALLAETSFATYPTHYLRDSRLPREAVKQLYQKWAVAACNDESGRYRALIAEEKGEPIGFGIFGYKENSVAEGVLAGVRRDAGVPGRKILQDLLVHGMYLMAQAGMKTATAVTQIENRFSCEFYTGLGSRLEGQFNTFHKWI